MDIHAPAAHTIPSDTNLRDYLAIILRRKVVFIQVFVLVLAVGIVSTLLTRPVYTTRATLLVPAGATSVNLVDTRDPLATILQSAQPDSVATQIQVLQSAPFIADALKEAGITPRPGVVPPMVRVQLVEGSNVIHIIVEGGDPRDISRLANALLELHLKRTSIVQSGGVDETVRLVRELKAKAEKQLGEAQRALIAFQKNHRVAELQADQESRTRELVDLQTRVREAASSVTMVEAQIADVRARLEKEPPALITETARDNPRRQKVEERLEELRFQRVNLLPQYKEGSRTIRDLDGQIASLQRQLDAEPKELKTSVSSPNPRRPPLEARLAELEATLVGHQAAATSARAQLEARQGTISDLGPWEVQLSRLKQEESAAQNAYNSLSDDLRKLEVRGSIKLVTVREIERAAVPTSPIRPRKMMNFALTGLLAVLLAAAMAFLVEYLDDRVNSAEDVEQISALPTLGQVPLMEHDQSRLLASFPANSRVAESYRALRTGIGFAAVEDPIRSMVVTSASKGEGKTLTTVNLATAMAVDGKRVILVDADLRGPSVHHVLNLMNTPGLSEVLAGLKGVDEVFQETSIANLRVITAGTVPPNPAELLGSQAFDNLLEDLQERADIVLFDTPPCVPITDPLLIAARADAVVLVLYAGHTKKAAIQQMQALLRRARARIIGVVFNRVRPNKSTDYYYYGYYGYGYGYGSRRRGELAGENGRNGRSKRRPRQIPSETATREDGDR